MRRDRALQMFQGMACIVCAILIWRYARPLAGAEFSGGRITEILLNMADLAVLLFVIAFLTGLRKTRLSAVISLAASLLALPLYFYFVAPGPFRRIFRREYSAPKPANFVWDASSLVGISVLGLACCFGILNLLRLRQNIRA